MTEHHIGSLNQQKRRLPEDEDSPDPVNTEKRKLIDYHYSYCRPFFPSDSPPLDLRGDLSVYIQHAEVSTFRNCTSDYPIFSRTAGYFTTPYLRKGRLNRILVYRGCFNPPHLGHLELLLHIFLRSDEDTIAAMIMPVGDMQFGKDDTMINGKPWCLTKKERMTLLDHPLLRRFSWFYTGRLKEAVEFQNAISCHAKWEGYDVTFVSVSGSDHYGEVLADARLGLEGIDRGSGDMITSDISRPSALLENVDTEGLTSQLPGCGPWRKTSPGGRTAHDLCRPCYRFQQLALNRPLGGTELESTALREFATDVLRRCHQGDGVVWMCTREQGGNVCFLPSGRQYPADGQKEISSSIIRKMLVDKEEGVLSLAMNAERLLKMLGLDPSHFKARADVCDSDHSTQEGADQRLHVSL
jgi:hypothetical protein